MAEGYLSLGISSALAKCCDSLGWKNPLPIQKSAIPPAIAGSSETGSGKTAAFLLPILQNWLNVGRPTGYALILAPTRELAVQIAETAKSIMSHFVEDVTNGTPGNPLNVFRLIGGENSVDQAISLAWCRHHLIVATLGRLVEHMKQSPGFAQHHLSTVRQLVLDEADRMLSMEFAEDIDTLLGVFERPRLLLAPTRHPNRAAKQTFLERREEELDAAAADGFKRKDRAAAYVHKGAKFPHPQTYLFTATMSKDVTKLRRAALDRDAVVCQGGGAGTVEGSDGTAGSRPQSSFETDLPAGLRHFCLPTRRTDKLATLDWVLEKAVDAENKGEEEDAQNPRIIVFCARCHETRYLAGFLAERGYSAVGLTGRMRQSDRKRVLDEFIQEEEEDAEGAGRTKILVATDVASRGLDLPLVGMIVNYGVPLTAKTYRHRVGRTARAGRSGIAVTIVTRDEGKAYLELEDALLPTKSRKEPRNCIPRWPQQLPSEDGNRKGASGEVGMAVRRRLADEAWSKAAKKLREERARRVQERRSKNHNLLSSSEDDENDDLLCDDDDDDGLEDSEQLANRHWASGAAGIEAARRSYAARKLQKRQQLGEDGEEADVDIDDGDEEEEEKGNLTFAQPIKEKKAAISAAKKKAATLKRMKKTRY